MIKDSREKSYIGYEMSCRNQRKTGPRRKKNYELIWPGDLYIIIIFFWFMFVVVVVGFSVFLFF